MKAFRIALKTVGAVVAIPILFTLFFGSRRKRPLRSARQMGAIATVKMLQSAAARYYATYGRYPHSLAELDKPANGTPNASAADLITKDLAQGEKGGYTYSMRTTRSGYQINAAPLRAQ